MAIKYHEALNMLQEEAQRHRPVIRLRAEHVPLQLAVNRVCAEILCAPRSTPLWDTSAMDGYALNSKYTKNASADNPIVFPVRGLIAAGRESIPFAGWRECQLPSCVEIMTGARFPSPQETCGVELDCCVKLGDVKRIEDPTTGQIHIQITKPVPYRNNRRVAGEDFQKDQVIVTAGEIIRSRHVMALASVGIKQIPVQPKLQVGLYSTGSELILGPGYQLDKFQIEDVNGPYIAAALADSIGAEVHFLGTLEDQVDMIIKTILQDVSERRYDIIITTGAVSAGRFDLIPSALERLQAKILFHRLGMRPGHPALFASIPSKSRESAEEIAFFGLPGNPVASAACLRFLVIPYVGFLQTQGLERPLTASLTCSGNGKQNRSSGYVTKLPQDKDVFRPGILSYSADGKAEVILIADHSPGKVRPFLEANCWIHFHRDQNAAWEGDCVDVYPGL